MINRSTKNTPGILSERTLDALNLQPAEYPLWIYRMRDEGPCRGYPPGYLKRFVFLKTF